MAAVPGGFHCTCFSSDGHLVGGVVIGSIWFVFIPASVLTFFCLFLFIVPWGTAA